MTSHSEKIIDLYRTHATAWVTQRGNTLFEKQWRDRFLTFAPKAPHILDIGCGFGEPVAHYLSESGGRVTGIDTSVELIQIAQTRQPTSTWTIADMRTLDLNTTFDAILAWNSSFHLTPDDQRKMFPIFRKHANAGAPLMFTTGTSYGEASGEFEGEPLYHSSLDPAEYRSLLTENGFTLLEHVVEDPTCGNHTIWLAHFDPSP